MGHPIFHIVPVMLSVKQEAMNTNFKVNGVTRLGIKPKSTAPEANSLTTRPSELFNTAQKMGLSLLNAFLALSLHEFFI